MTRPDLPGRVTESVSSYRDATYRAALIAPPPPGRRVPVHHRPAGASGPSHTADRPHPWRGRSPAECPLEPPRTAPDPAEPPALVRWSGHFCGPARYPIDHSTASLAPLVPIRCFHSDNLARPRQNSCVCRASTTRTPLHRPRRRAVRPGTTTARRRTTPAGLSRD